MHFLYTSLREDLYDQQHIETFAQFYYYELKSVLQKLNYDLQSFPSLHKFQLDFVKKMFYGEFTTPWKCNKYSFLVHSQVLFTPSWFYQLWLRTIPTMTSLHTTPTTTGRSTSRNECWKHQRISELWKKCCRRLTRTGFWTRLCHHRKTGKIYKLVNSWEFLNVI